MADLSPELAARIQSLEGLYADNAGRYYVALAGAWREAGEPARAEEILRENLKRYPGLSAHVLLGRCLADRGAVDEAANEFHYVLSIDAQNLIALRTLAEMAAGAGRNAEAARWYNELLSVDPMNAEARQALLHIARADTGADAATADQPLSADAWGGTGEGAPPAGAASDSGFADDGEFGMIDLAPADLEPAPAAADDDADSWGEISLDLPADQAAEDASADAAPAADEPDAEEPVDAPAGDFDAFGFGSVALDAEPSPASADASDEWPAFDARDDLGEAAAADVGLAAFPGDDVDGDDDEAHAAAVDAEVVTETMAELCARQGLLPRAAEIYRELIRQRGEEPALVRRLDDLEARMREAEQAAVAEAAPEQAGWDEPPASPSGSRSAPDPALPVDGDEGAPDWLESVDAFARGERESALPDVGLDTGLPALELAGDDMAQDAPADAREPALAAAPADAFADSFVNGFAGAEPARAWESPAVAAMDEDEALAHASAFAHDAEEAMSTASAEEAVDLSAAWAVAAAPLEEQEEAAAAGGESPGSAADEEPAAAVEEAPADVAAGGEAPLELVGTAEAADRVDADEGEDESVPAAAAVESPTPASSPTGRTMRGYFASHLAWQPGASPDAEPAAEAPTAAEPEPSADAASTEPVHAAEPEPAPWDAVSSAEAAAGPEVEPQADADPWEAPAPAAAEEDEDASARVTAEDEPWAAAPTAAGPDAGDAPGSAAPPAGEPEATLDAEPGVDDEPWSAAPSPASAEPVDIGSFELDEASLSSAETEPAAEAAPAPDAAAGAEEPLPWEMPAEPAAADAAPEPAADAPFSFEDFFSPGDEPAPPAEQPAAPVEAPRAPEPPPPPAAEAPAPPAPAPGAPAGGQEEDDEDLESFQAWLQSLKR